MHLSEIKECQFIFALNINLTNGSELLTHVSKLIVVEDKTCNTIISLIDLFKD